MPRNRMIKASFWEDDRLAELPFETRLFFISMWNFADDEGFLELREKWLKAKCFPYDDVGIRRMLDELSSIDRVEIQNGIIWIKNFLKHQRIDRPSPSNLSQLYNDSTNIRRGLDERSTHKDKLSKDKLSKKKEKQKHEITITPSQIARQFFNLPMQKEVFQAKLVEAGCPEDLAQQEIEKFIDYWTEPNKSGTRQRWELQKTFDVHRRLKSWFRNMKNFNPSQIHYVA